MKERLMHIWYTYEETILIILGVSVLGLTLSLFALNLSMPRSEDFIKPAQEEIPIILEADAPLVEDIPILVSFENIPDDKYLPPSEGKAIRINLVTMTLLQYENGQLVRAPIPILAKGKVGSFWETPGGLYPITNKEEDFFSEKVGAYLPYTLYLFGNYVIHGIPHDVNNKPLPKLGNGGIRLADTDAALLYDWADVNTGVSIFSDSKIKPAPVSTESVYITAEGAVRPKVTAESYIVGDLDTGEVIIDSRKDAVYPIASVSKLMTALVSIENMNQFDFAKISPRASSVVSVSRFKAGEKIALSNLIYPLLLPSSNVAAEVIAEHYGRDRFILAMNQQARKLKMENTFFDDPSGLSEKNVSSAHDLFVLMQHLFKEKRFIFDITLRPSYSAQGYTWKSISPFLKTKGFLGGKGGLTTEAKQTYAGVFSLPLSELQNRNVGIIVLRSSDRQSDIMKILSFLKSRVVYGTSKDFTVIDTKNLTRDITMNFVGDIMLDRGVRYSVQNNFDGDYSHLFDNTGYLKESDLTFGNLEGPASDKGTDLRNLYSFRMEPQVLDVLHAAGFDVLSFANNHVGDWGREAFDDTLKRITDAGMQATGAGSTKAEAERPVIKEIKGVKFGFLGFSDVGPTNLQATTTSSGILLASDPRLSEIIKNAKKQVDVLIVSFHWGVEYKEHTKRQTTLARQAVDAGAALVIGHHPHVSQSVETYKNGLIAYSLGNFVFDQGFSQETMQGTVLSVTFDAKEKRLKTFDRYISKQNPQFQPQPREIIKK